MYDTCNSIVNMRFRFLFSLLLTILTFSIIFPLLDLKCYSCFLMTRAFKAMKPGIELLIFTNKTTIFFFELIIHLNFAWHLFVRSSLTLWCRLTQAAHWFFFLDALLMFLTRNLYVCYSIDDCILVGLTHSLVLFPFERANFF